MLIINAKLDNISLFHNRTSNFDIGFLKIRAVLNRGVFNRAVLNRGVFNRAVLNRAVLNRGVFNRAF